MSGLPEAGLPHGSFEETPTTEDTANDGAGLFPARPAGAEASFTVTPFANPSSMSLPDPPYKTDVDLDDAAPDINPDLPHQGGAETNFDLIVS